MQNNISKSSLNFIIFTFVTRIKIALIRIIKTNISIILTFFVSKWKLPNLVTEHIQYQDISTNKCPTSSSSSVCSKYNQPEAAYYEQKHSKRAQVEDGRQTKYLLQVSLKMFILVLLISR